MKKEAAFVVVFVVCEVSGRSGYIINDVGSVYKDYCYEQEQGLLSTAEECSAAASASADSLCPPSHRPITRSQFRTHLYVVGGIEPVRRWRESLPLPSFKRER